MSEQNEVPNIKDYHDGTTVEFSTYYDTVVGIIVAEDQFGDEQRLVWIPAAGVGLLKPIATLRIRYEEMGG